MTSIIPILSESQINELPSRAEAKVYRALRDNLSDKYTVFFQVGWILQREEESARDGETDFVICHPDFGYVCIEVKGGGVGFDSETGNWFSIDRHKQKHSINNPINQGLKAKYSIKTKLNEQKRWKDLALTNVLIGHAVFFPDVGNAFALSRPDMPQELIGTSNSLNDIASWVDTVFSCWGARNSNITPLGKRGLDIFHEIFARSFEALPLTSTHLAEQEQKRLILTKDQMRVLDLLRSRRRVAISGGAGTGKTVLALEKARRLAADGFKTLLTCYNRQLADHLSKLCEGIPNLDVMSFHQLCYRRVEIANSVSGRDLLAEAKITYPRTNVFEVQLPNALGYSLEILPERYDAIVCDEGQDFREEFWVPLELLLADLDNSPLYVFFDDNQNIYARAGTFPIHDEAFPLTTNCRNTIPIHEAAYKGYQGSPVTPPENDGEKIQFIYAQNRRQQAAKINSSIVDLITQQEVSPGDIVVLLGDAYHKAGYYAELKALPLPRGSMWLEEGERSESTVLIDTIQRFKGLESPVVFLWGLDNIDLAKAKEHLYIGISRAKSLLVVGGDLVVRNHFERET